MNFVMFHPFSVLKMDGACCKRSRHLYTTTAQLCCIPASYCHLSVTRQTMSIIVVNLQDNRAVFRIFIALLRFSFDSPLYIHTYIHTYTHRHIHAHIHTYTHTYTHTYIHTYIHTHTCTHTYIHTYTHIHVHIHTY